MKKQGNAQFWVRRVCSAGATSKCCSTSSAQRESLLLTAYISSCGRSFRSGMPHRRNHAGAMEITRNNWSCIRDLSQIPCCMDRSHGLVELLSVEFGGDRAVARRAGDIGVRAPRLRAESTRRPSREDGRRRVDTPTKTRAATPVGVQPDEGFAGGKKPEKNSAELAGAAHASCHVNGGTHPRQRGEPLDTRGATPSAPFAASALDRSRSELELVSL